MSGELTKAVADLQEDEAIKLVNQMLESGADPNEILVEARVGMETVGKRFGDGEYFLPELIFSAEIFKELTEILKPKMQSEVKQEKLGKVIVGTVAGDIHDIGKEDARERNRHGDCH